MVHRKHVCNLLLCSLLLTPLSWAQCDPGCREVTVYDLRDLAGRIVGHITVVGLDGGHYRAGFEYWQVSEEFLLEPEQAQGLQIVERARGGWGEQDVLDALEESVEGTAVEWSHPTRVSWTESQHQSPPDLSAATFFGDPSIGGFAIHYERDGHAALTWFNFSGEVYVPFGNETVFAYQEDAPEEGAWWYGPIQSLRI